MVTTIKERNGVLYCGNCHIRVMDLRHQVRCKFCGYEFANWEQLMIKMYKEGELEDDFE